MAGRGRLSSIDLLPEEAEDDIAWACQELAANKRTIDDIHQEFNERLVEKNIDPISRTSFHRKAFKLARAQRRMAESRAMFEGLAPQFTADNVDDSNVVLGELIKTLIQELVLSETVVDPKGAMELARAYQATTGAMKVSSDRRQKVNAENAAKARKAVTEVGKAAGLSAERISELNRKLLGVRT